MHQSGDLLGSFEERAAVTTRSVNSGLISLRFRRQEETLPHGVRPRSSVSGNEIQATDGEIQHE